MVDLSKMNVAQVSDEGAEMTIRHPVDGTVVKLDDGTPMSIKLVGKYSQTYRKAERSVLDRRISQQVGKRKVKVSYAQVEEEECETLAKCVIGWNIVVDGKTPEANFDNAYKFFSDPRFTFVKEQVIEFIDDLSNFTKTS